MSVLQVEKTIYRVLPKVLPLDYSLMNGFLYTCEWISLRATQLLLESGVVYFQGAEIIEPNKITQVLLSHQEKLIPK